MYSLKQRLDYNPDTGEMYFYHLKKKRFVSCESVDKDGYLQVRINKKMYTVHRLAWYLSYGVWPECIDHINHNKMDNRIANLRNVSRSENNKNLDLRNDNTSGFNGVYYHKLLKKWYATANFNRKKYHLGVFEKKEDAIKERKKFNNKIGFHKNHGVNL